jgi:hypothetical protein
LLTGPCSLARSDKWDLGQRRRPLGGLSTRQVDNTRTPGFHDGYICLTMTIVYGSTCMAADTAGLPTLVYTDWVMLAFGNAGIWECVHKLRPGFLLNPLSTGGVIHAAYRE